MHFFATKQKIHDIIQIVNRNKKDKKMKKQYEKFLLEHGYSEKSGRLLPSTIYAYIRGIEHACRYENLSIEQLAENNNVIAPTYEAGQKNSVKGLRLSRAVRCSLRQFQKFINQQQGAVC